LTSLGDYCSIAHVKAFNKNSDSALNLAMLTLGSMDADTYKIPQLIS